MESLVVVFAILIILQTCLLIVARSNERRRIDEVLALAKRWEEIAAKWKENYDGMEAASASFERTANSALAMLAEKEK